MHEQFKRNPRFLICKEEHMYQNTGAKIGINIPMNSWWIEGLSFAIHAKTAKKCIIGAWQLAIDRGFFHLSSHAGVNEEPKKRDL